MSFTSGQLAKQAGVNLETIRFYERSGLLPIPVRSASGYRTYPEAMTRRIRFIKRAQGLGFTLIEIGQLLSLSTSAVADRAEVRSIAHARLEQIEEKIGMLEAMRSALTSLTDQCSGHGSVDDCPIVQAIEAE